MMVVRIKTCKDCGEPLDSVDHLMRCQVPDKTWQSSKDSKAGEWD